MGSISYARVAALSAVAGAALATGIMAAVAIRTAYTVTTGHRWDQLKKLGKAW